MQSGTAIDAENSTQKTGQGSLARKASVAIGAVSIPDPFSAPQDMLEESGIWNEDSPIWKPVENECQTQAKQLIKYLNNKFEPHFWDVKLEGGSKWKAAAKPGQLFGTVDPDSGIRNHHVVGVHPKANAGNPSNPRHIDPFKYGTPAFPIKRGDLADFQKEYPYPPSATGKAN